MTQSLNNVSLPFGNDWCLVERTPRRPPVALANGTDGANLPPVQNLPALSTTYGTEFKVKASVSEGQRALQTQHDLRRRDVGLIDIEGEVPSTRLP